jgi:hypothetical protein
MRLIANHNIKNGVWRLTNQPRDLRPDGGAKDLSMAAAPPGYIQLYHDYLRDLEEVLAIAGETWNAEVEDRQASGLTVDEAILDVIETNGVAGPASHPAVVWLVRKYWLECARIGTGKPDAVRPETFLLGWLIEDRRDDAVTLLTAMPYWPIGLDEDGNWC